MNSCILILFSECLPPFNIFIIGTGSSLPFSPPIYLYNSIPSKLLAAFATANDTPNIAFAPKLDLFNVSSNFIIALSIFSCSHTFIPIIFLLIFLFTFSTAFKHPFPLYLAFSPSRNSTASKLPVEAPDGTDATPLIPLSVVTFT